MPTFGIDKDITDAQAWSLESITYPTGGKESYIYENDSIDDDTIPYIILDLFGAVTYGTLDYAQVFGGYSFRRQGGVRVKQITRVDSMGNSLNIGFSYGLGHAPTIPPRLVAWGILPQINVNENEYKVANRGDLDIVYEYIERTYPEKEVKYFDISLNNRKTTIINNFQTGTLWHFYTDDKNFNWGLLDSTSIEFGDFRQTGKFINENYSRPTGGWQLHPLVPTLNFFQYSPIVIEEFHRRFKDSSPTKQFVTHIDRTLLTETRQVKEIIITTSDREIREKIKYAHEEGDYGGSTWDPNSLQKMRAENLLALVAERDVFFKDINVFAPASILQSASRTTYKEVQKWMTEPDMIENVWKPDRLYDLNTGQTLTFAPAFNAWQTGQTPQDPDWQLNFEAIQYQYGRLRKYEDANDNLLEVFYGNNSNNFDSTNTENSFGRAYVTAVQLAGNLTKEFDYNTQFMQVNAIQDESNNITSFTFDDFGRLSSIVNPQGETVQTNDYFFSRELGAFDPTKPNYIKSQLLCDGVNTIDTYEYYDGLGRLLQTISDTSAATSGVDFVTALEVDMFGRTEKAYKAYKKSAATAPHLYDAQYALREEDGSTPGGSSERFSETHYSAFLVDQIHQIDFPGPKSSANSNSFTFEYILGYDEFPSLYYTNEPTDVMLRKIAKTDEIGQTTYMFEDETGREIAKREFGLDAQSQPIELNTHFEYDGAGNILTVRPPNYFEPPTGSNADDWVTTYEYNTINQMTKKISPDAPERLLTNTTKTATCASRRTPTSKPRVKSLLSPMILPTGQ